MSVSYTHLDVYKRQVLYRRSPFGEEAKITFSEGPWEDMPLFHGDRIDVYKRQERQLLTLQLQAQFDMLQAQVNPHFIYNALNVISSRRCV